MRAIRTGVGAATIACCSLLLTACDQIEADINRRVETSMQSRLESLRQEMLAETTRQVAELRLQHMGAVRRIAALEEGGGEQWFDPSVRTFQRVSSEVGDLLIAIK